MGYHRLNLCDLTDEQLAKAKKLEAATPSADLMALLKVAGLREYWNFLYAQWEAANG